MPIVTKDNATEAFRFIAPVVKVALDGTPTLIGTAFFITTTGVIVTAKHVIEDNLDEHSRDTGGIGVLWTYGSHLGVYRSLRQSYWHGSADIAISETSRFANDKGEEILNDVLALSVAPQPRGEPISTQFFHATGSSPTNRYRMNLAIRFCGGGSRRTFRFNQQVHQHRPRTETFTGFVLQRALRVASLPTIFRTVGTPSCCRFQHSSPTYPSTLEQVAVQSLTREAK